MTVVSQHLLKSSASRKGHVYVYLQKYYSKIFTKISLLTFLRPKIKVNDMRKELHFEPVSNVDQELSMMSVDDLRKELSESEMKLKVVQQQKKDLTKGFSNLIKDIKLRSTKILEVLEAKDSATARKVLTEVSR